MPQDCTSSPFVPGERHSLSQSTKENAGVEESDDALVLEEAEDFEAESDACELFEDDESEDLPLLVSEILLLVLDDDQWYFFDGWEYFDGLVLVVPMLLAEILLLALEDDRPRFLDSGEW